MKNKINQILKFFKTILPADSETRRQQEIHDYLSKSVSLVDLDRRQRELEQQGYFWR